VILDSKNNLFAELEVVQHSMVLFYDMIVQGIISDLKARLCAWLTNID